MRGMLLMVWLLIPIGVGFYHFGPGQTSARLDSVGATLTQARADALNERWTDAITGFESALAALPEDKVHENRQIRLELAKAQMLDHKLPEANESLETLVAEMTADPSTDPKLLDEAKAAQANSQYYLTWLMRLEGEPRATWEPEIESARQTFRLLAEKAEQSGDEANAKRHREDLESSIRLARMDLKDLQGLPLPSQ